MELKFCYGFFHLFIAFIITYYLDFCNCKCTKKQLINNKNLSNTTFTELSLWSKSGVESPAACASECGRDKQCVSFFYNTQSGVCTAHTVRFYSKKNSIVDEGSLYYTLPVDKRDCSEVLNNEPDSPDGVYIINPDDGIGPARVYCDMSTGGSGWTVIQDCAEILSNDPDSPSGVYFINPADGVGHFKVYCDMTTDGGGWTVFQRRQDGSVDFYKYWDDYKVGFGQVDAEFWLGNDYINRLTSQGSYKLRIDMRDQDDQSGYATYSTFHVGNESNNYRLKAKGYAGNAVDGLRWHNGKMFSAGTRDNDTWLKGDCARRNKSGWWFAKCYVINLNGVYGDGIILTRTQNVTLEWVEMKLKHI